MINAIREKFSLRLGRLLSTWINVGLAGVVTAGVVTVCGYGHLLVIAQVENKLRDNPVLVQHLGTIEKAAFSIDLAGSYAYSESDIWVYRVRGSRGEGRVTVNSATVDADEEKIIWAWLTKPGGETVHLVGKDEEVARRKGREPPPPWIGVIAGVVIAAAGVWIVRSGSALSAAQMEVKLRDNPVLVQHLGIIKKGAFSTDWVAFWTLSDKNLDVYRVRGSHGEGRVTVNSQAVPGGEEKITWARLTTMEGETIQLMAEDEGKNQN